MSASVLQNISSELYRAGIATRIVLLAKNLTHEDLFAVESREIEEIDVFDYELPHCLAIRRSLGITREFELNAELLGDASGEQWPDHADVTDDGTRALQAGKPAHFHAEGYLEQLRLGLPVVDGLLDLATLAFFFPNGI